MEALQPLLLIAVFIAFFYFLAIRPQRRRQQELQRLQKSLKTGDEVITMAGIYGTVTEVEEGGTILLEISEDTEIRVAAASISQVVNGTSSTSSIEPFAASE